MRLAYFDCFSGISGDMCLGALLANGLCQEALVDGLRGLDGWEISARQVNQHGIAAMDVEVRVSGEQPHRRLGDILELIGRSPLPGRSGHRPRPCLPTWHGPKPMSTASMPPPSISTKWGRSTP